MSMQLDEWNKLGWDRDLEFGDVVGTTLKLEEIGERIGESDLDVLNDQLSDFGLSQCLICETWVYSVNDDWECPDCEKVNNAWKYPDWEDE